MSLVVDGPTAFLDYIISKLHIIYLTHTEVPQSWEGQGVGSAIVAKAIDFIKGKNLMVALQYPFVTAYLKRHPELADGLLASGYAIR